MIIAKLTGGIGNQMFQYAAGRRLAILNNTQLKLDLSHYDNLVWADGLPYRSFDLSIFTLDINVATAKEIDLFQKGPAPLLKKAVKKVTNLISPHLEIIEPHFHFYPELLSLRGNFYLHGYWQCEKYFEDIESTIREDFTIKTSLGNEGVAMLNKIQGSNAVCLNVRRQEFATNKYINQFVGESYLEKAVELMSSKISDPHFYIFSDDLPWCKENLKLDFPHTFVEEHLYGERFKDCLFLMTSCKHYIIPNSTFGWWAAWLSKNKEKVVIAPQKWLSDPKRDTKDVAPPSWIRI